MRRSVIAAPDSAAPDTYRSFTRNPKPFWKKKRKVPLFLFRHFFFFSFFNWFLFPSYQGMLHFTKSVREWMVPMSRYGTRAMSGKPYREPTVNLPHGSSERPNTIVTATNFVQVRGHGTTRWVCRQSNRPSRSPYTLYGIETPLAIIGTFAVHFVRY